MTPTNFIPPLVVSLVVWRVYRRVRRNIGRQPLQPKRLVLRIAIFTFIAVMLAVMARESANVLMGFAGGILLGVPLALVGLYLTRFEVTPEGKFYTPNTYIGVGLSLLLIARIAYRLFLLYSAAPVPGKSPAALGNSPLTLGVFGLMAGYYIVYLTGVLWHSRDVKTSI